VNYTVKAAARATGVSESRLRTWERRYGIPSPARSATHRRLYDESDLTVIRRMADLVEAGLSASDAADAARAGLDKEAETGHASPAPPHPLIAQILLAAGAFDEPTMVRALLESVTQLGWAAALDDIIFPAMLQLGMSWESAMIPPAKEHFASELVRRAIAAEVHATEFTSDGPRVLLACPEGERHDLGLLALSLLLRKEGANVVYLGADVPTVDLLEVDATLHPEAICLSATGATGLASLVRSTRIILTSRRALLFIGGPAVSRTGAVAAGIRLPVSLAEAAHVILERIRRHVPGGGAAD
jgi:MerR family transcriptional regulator, light-induced transcriptional regulator